MRLFTRYLQSIRLATSMALLLMVAFSTPAAAQLDNSQDQIFPNCDHPDYPALMSFYASTNGSDWANNDGWAAGAAGEDCTPCDWLGVDCNAQGRVIVIKLPFNKLTGTLPANLGNFPFLRGLVLQSNDISGQLPFSIDQLANLRFLDVSKNQLMGYLPPEIGDLTALKYLLLNNNKLTDAIPQELADLNQLEVLRLNDNNLSCTYEELDALCAVPDLDFSNNPLLPWEGDFTQYCAGADQIGAPCNGDNVILDACTCGPATPACHPDFDALMALYNSTDGANWTNNDGWVDGAAGTDCDPCSWYGVNCFSDGRVRELTLNVNNLNGVIPEEIGALSTIIYLNLGSNPLLSGTIPAGITSLENLQFLFIYNADLQGNLPQDIGAMSNLIAISFSNSNLSGTIPASILELSLIQEIILRGNELTEGIPEAIGNLPDLRRLDLSYNQLSGQIPASLGNSSELWQLNLHHNQLDGLIPPQLANATNLTQIRLQNNSLTGPIPAALAELPELALVNLRFNDLEDCLDNLLVWCDLPSDVYRYSGNRRLPWFGDAEQVCANDPSTPAPCDQDGDPSTDDEGIVNEFCECGPSGESTDRDKRTPMETRGQQLTTTGTSAPAGATQLVVYPNPVGQQRSLNISLPNAKEGYTISLRSISGQVVLEQQLQASRVELDLSNMSPGLYFVNAQSATEKWVKKVVVR